MKVLIDNGHGAETPGNGSEKRPGKMVVSLLNVERETARRHLRHIIRIMSLILCTEQKIRAEYRLNRSDFWE